jgi:hypothetical protein
MDADTFGHYRQLTFMETRVPALDALSVFIREGQLLEGRVRDRLEQGPNRWYPAEGGQRVLLLYEGGDFEADLFTIEPKAWDHEHCTRCRAHIPAMTLLGRNP